ncbi:hypothetical protein E1281_29435 [Actinomadura sp. KC345]|uniref:hypothetical protein n=1 Tax=Actinomadura sp. KC345 TaxID=2530371 RepID=UPI0010462B02|nr:hypothetical protein [Actinomadura sp. KC345]TDC45796.1 hypothetical protein E1281_29435 [Actinomadura sp. KC345]
MSVTQSQQTAGPRARSGLPAADRQWWRPRRSTRKLLTVVHVASSVALLGEVWVLVVLNLTATLTSDGALAHAAYRLMGVLVFGGGIPLSMISLASGIALGLGSRWGIARHYWVFAKLLLLIGVILAGMLLFTPEAMADATAGGASPSGGRQWTQVAVVSAQAAMLLTATALSVYKPRRRMGRSGS